MFIDTHCHLDTYKEVSGEEPENLFERIKNDSDPNVKMPEAFIHVACNPRDFEFGKKVADKFEFVYTSFGIHPEYVLEETLQDEDSLRNYLKLPKCVACGEFGLDYHYGKDLRTQQIKLFERHLNIALESKKTLVLHLRECDEDAIDILSHFNLTDRNIHVHCFTGSKNFCEKLLNLHSQIFIGFTGIITFKNAENVRESASIVPINQMLLETDSPYLSPVPYRGKPSHSGYIPYIVKALSQVKNISEEELYKNCRENTKRCYGI